MRWAWLFSVFRAGRGRLQMTVRFIRARKEAQDEICKIAVG